jgi:hypothetical protein
MNFDIHKYDKTTFSYDVLTDKRIKALLLWFEYEVYVRKIPLSSQIPMMTKWINKLEVQEYYELIPFFTKMRDDMVETYETDKFNSIPIKNTDNVTVDINKEPFLIRLKNKIIKLWVDF